MADEEGNVRKIVSDVTKKALQEFSLDGNADEKPPSRPPTGRSSTRPGSASKTGSAKGSRPSSGVSKSSRPPSGTAAKAPSPATSRRGSASSDRPRSRSASRERVHSGTPGAGSRRGSGSAASPKPAGSKPGSAGPGTASSKPAGGSKPGSARSQAASPKSGGSKPSSARSKPSRPTSSARGSKARVSRDATETDDLGVVGSRPGSAREDDRPASERSASGRRGSASRLGTGSEENTARDLTGDDDFVAEGQWATGGQELDEEEGDEEEEDMYETPGRGSAAQTRTPTAADRQSTDLQDTYALMSSGHDEYDDEDGEEEEGYRDQEEGLDSDDSEEEQELVVLDPDHPLMQRFQKALLNHLEKQNEKVTLALRELEEATNKAKKDRENLGVELYGIQQDLAKQQMILEKHQDEHADLNQDRTQAEDNLREMRQMYREKQTGLGNERKQGSDLQTQVENLALRLFYVENARGNVRSDISVMKRAAHKADTEVVKAEQLKQKQDLYVDRLVERLDKLREEIAMYETQMSAQSQETKATREALTEAHMEIESINLEKKQLYQQWSSSLIGMRRRDEAHNAMLEALHQQQQRILSMEGEVEGYKKSVQKEQEQNEKLMFVHNKTEADIATTKKLLQQVQERHEALKNEYATYTRMLQETELALNRANSDKSSKLNEINALRIQIEKEYLERVKLEDMIIEKMQAQLTLDKASKYTDKLTQKLRERKKELETQVAKVENDIARDTLEASNIRTRIERLQRTLDELDDEIARKNDIINKSETEIVKRNAIIERKQGIIDQYNKKLEHMITSAGGVELGPLEIQINSLQKSIDAQQHETAELQQMWLRDQSELVHLSKEKEKQSQDVENLKKQLTILSQKKIRTEGNINRQNLEMADIERSIRHMQNDMIKLNKLIHKEKGIQMDLSQNNVLMENDFVGSLKEAEHESIELQEELDKLKEEKERLLNSLVEAERQIMLWEKKTQLARETRAAVDSDIGQGEIKAMKAEIHRMQVRYAQLMKQQERMIQDMEKAVSRRDTIVTRGDAQSKVSNASKQVLTKGKFQRQMAELRKKIKTTVQDASSCDSEIRELRENQQELSAQLEQRQLAVQQLQGASDALDGDIERLAEQKQKNMQELLSRQQRNKYYQQVKDKKYSRVCKSDAALDDELDRQMNRLQTLHAIVDRLNKDFPHAQPSLTRATLMLESRALPAADD